MIDITDEIRDAIRQAIESCGSQCELARHTNIHATHINRYLSGKTRRISQENWTKLAPCLVRWLPPDPMMPHLRHLLASAPCPLPDCPSKGLTHEPLTAALLEDWAQLDKSAKLEALQAIGEIMAKRSAASRQ
jgi:hypothetical protein